MISSGSKSCSRWRNSCRVATAATALKTNPRRESASRTSSTSSCSSSKKDEQAHRPLAGRPRGDVLGDHAVLPLSSRSRRGMGPDHLTSLGPSGAGRRGATRRIAQSEQLPLHFGELRSMACDVPEAPPPSTLLVLADAGRWSAPGRSGSCGAGRSGADCRPGGRSVCPLRGAQLHVVAACSGKGNRREWSCPGGAVPQCDQRPETRRPWTRPDRLQQLRGQPKSGSAEHHAGRWWRLTRAFSGRG